MKFEYRDHDGATGFFTVIDGKKVIKDVFVSYFDGEASCFNGSEYVRDDRIKRAAIQEKLAYFAHAPNTHTYFLADGKVVTSVGEAHPPESLAVVYDYSPTDINAISLEFKTILDGAKEDGIALRRYCEDNYSSDSLCAVLLDAAQFLKEEPGDQPENRLAA